ncbi:tetratricopeptide repeat protein [Coprococcus sp. NSJ-10]|jgi:hypothetical protein|uniref:Tetratricopeptide repeat protein n=1 Tax=Coprococcus hominis (ex Liu et al. 2022) TaxID=2763039 RepID=A0A8I0AP27_9FIRM|nr:tetratricopeptide repeat protein [Coprococcus hominis (ex Liu et al. 2022)]MBC5662482.1 tetratricopeptide repeat protein [Coprococcus hominis (ex Liu et al. 2022)]
MTGRNRRRRRKRKSNIDFVKVFFFLVTCLVIVFAAVVILSKIISHKDRYFDEGLAFYQNAEYDKALDRFADALSEKQIFSRNKDKNTRLYMADIYMKTADYDKAVEEYDTILQQTSSDKKNVGKMKEIAQALADFSDSNYAGALPVLEQYVKDYPELYLYIGTCYASMNDAEHMFENYEKYIDKYGYNSYLYAQYAAYYISIGEMDNAYGYINNGLASDNTFQKELRLQEISYYEKIQNYDKAYELAKELYELYPEYQDGVDEYNFLYTRVSHDDE